MINEHNLVEFRDTGLYYCKICNKAEIELSDPCLKSTQPNHSNVIGDKI